MLGCGQTTTVSTQELSVDARICSITFSQWTYSCASFLVANWILVIGNIFTITGLQHGSARDQGQSSTRECSSNNRASTREWNKRQSLHQGVFNRVQNPPPGVSTRKQSPTREYQVRGVSPSRECKKVLKRLWKHTHTQKTGGTSRSKDPS